jgi:hypothetical protein
MLRVRNTSVLRQRPSKVGPTLRVRIIARG